MLATPLGTGAVIASRSGEYPLRLDRYASRLATVKQRAGALGRGESGVESNFRWDHDALTARLIGMARVAADLNAASDDRAVAAIVTARAAEVLEAVAVSMSILVTPTILEVIELSGDTSRTIGRGSRFPLELANPVTDAARTGQPIFAAGRAEIGARWPELSAGRDGSERSIAALPLLAGGRCCGVLGLAFGGCLSWSELDRQFLTTVADMCAQALARVAAQDAEQDRLLQMSFLMTATSRLTSTLDYQATLQGLADLVVPDLADWCAIDILDDGLLHPLAVAHVDPAKVALARHMRETYPPDTSSPSGAHVVARTGVAEIWEDVDPALIEAAAQDEEHLRLVRDLDLRSAIIVPLSADDRTLGVLTLVRTGEARRYSRDDLRFAEELARLAAVAVDNAQVHSETLEASHQLQRAVLPSSFAGSDLWEVAVDYRPAGRTAVGGDFYDAVPLADGRLVAFVGDVMGRGVAAAAAMAQVRSALRAYIALDPDPQTVIERLSLMFESIDVPQLVTVLYAVLDPGQGTAEFISAGHLPPIVIRVDGRTERLIVPSSPPLGAGEHPREPVTVEVAVGDTLLMYTDGLVERRGEDLDEGLDRLLHAAGRLHGHVSDQQLLLLADELRQSGHDDDVTLLAVRSLNGH